MSGDALSLPLFPFPADRRGFDVNFISNLRSLRTPREQEKSLFDLPTVEANILFEFFEPGQSQDRIGARTHWGN